eukprot:Tbor_TRINITY_DN5442_c1_g17::TRINITY_DN5442_c1_g17_i1::g.25145::m.25145
MSLAKDKFKALGKKSGANQAKKKDNEKLTDEQREALGFAVDVIAVDSIGISKVNEIDEVWNKQTKQKDAENDDESSSLVASTSSPNTNEEEKPKLFRASGSSRAMKAPEVSIDSLPSIEDIVTGAVSLAPTPVLYNDKGRKITPFDPYNPNDKKVSGGNNAPQKFQAPNPGIYVPGGAKLGRKITSIEEFTAINPVPTGSNPPPSGVYKAPSSSSNNHSSMPYSNSSPTVSTPSSSGNSNVYRPPGKSAERKFTPIDEISSRPLSGANPPSDNPNLYRPGRMRKQNQK